MTAIPPPGDNELSGTPARPSTFPIVGIGASAGGLEAFTQLLRNLPADSGMAFVLVQHLDPKHESRLADLLAKITRMPVQEVADRSPVRPDHVYVIPPNTIMTLSEDGLHLAPRSDIRGQHLPIDLFFKSLAEQRQTTSIGVILSGNGSDGTVGLEEIKAAGGITFAQDESAVFPSMPHSAVDAGCVDLVLSPDEIARELARIGRHPYVLPADVDPATVSNASDSGAGVPFSGIIELLRRSSGVDFGAYRDSTIQRRIRRRMVLHRRERVDDYLQDLQGDRAELDALYHDILISVTSFFRDPDAFEALKQTVFPEIMKGKSPNTPIRFWVPGCSTGQEAYSLAMVLLEFLDARPFRPPIQIFATDLSDAISLQRARDGEYPANIEAEVSPERLRRFFSKQNGKYRIDKGIRDFCVFAKQNVTADPPFSRVDLISCRNLLIYLSPPLQRRVIPTFHYALNPGGYLLLGGVESIGPFSELFSPVDHRHRIYLKNPSAGRPYPHFETQAVFGAPVGLRAGLPVSSVDWRREADRVALGHYAPPGVLLNDALEVLDIRGQVSPYLAIAPGEPSFKLFTMVREGLLFDLRAALAECRERNAVVRRTAVRVLTEGGVVREISLQVMPVTLPGTTERCFLVQFEPGRTPGEPGAGADDPAMAPANPAPASTEGSAATAAEREVVSLRHELTSTREYLQSVIEQQDASHEELQAAHEEILSANEELQSTNEELETAKEELQSVNEELITVNEQLQTRNAELARLDDDATNLFTSANVPMLVVGIDLRLRRYTPAAAKLLGVTPADIGRPLTTFRLPIDIPDLETLAADVIDTVQVTEREVQGRDGRMYVLRLHPYRTADKRIDGAVIVFMDVDEVARARAQMALARDQLQGVVDTVWEPLLVLDPDARVVSANRPFYEMFEVTSGEVLGQLLFDLAGGRWNIAELRRQLDEVLTLGTELRELEVTVELERRGRRVMLLNARRVAADGSGRQHILLAFEEVTARRELEQGLRVQRDELVTAGHRKDEFLAMLAHELRNPLGPMSAAVQILRLSTRVTAEAEHAWAIMDRQVHHMTRLIDDLLDVSRITTGRIELRREWIDLGTTVNIVAAAMQSRVEAAKHELVIDLPSEPLVVHADPLRLGQIIENFLTNAVKYTDPGGRIELSARQTEHETVLRVCDNGIGLAADLLPSIWDPFVQAEPSGPRSRSGLGIGLTLVRRLVELHGGTVEAHSDGLGRGSEFTVRLPRPHQEAAAAPAEPPSARSPDLPGDPRIVLIVEDNQDAAASMQMLLQLLGHEASVAHTGQDALSLAAAHRFDLIFLDIGLPDINGYEVARRLRDNVGLRDVLLVALSGHGGEEDRRRSQTSGIDAHVVKPITPDLLKKLLAGLSPRRGS